MHDVHPRPQWRIGNQTLDVVIDALAGSGLGSVFGVSFPQVCARSMKPFVTVGDALFDEIVVVAR